jgi:hypothetical protein
MEVVEQHGGPDAWDEAFMAFHARFAPSSIGARFGSTAQRCSLAFCSTVNDEVKNSRATPTMTSPGSRIATRLLGDESS